jgi:hypothetical protein
VKILHGPSNFLLCIMQTPGANSKISMQLTVLSWMACRLTGPHLHPPELLRLVETLGCAKPEATGKSDHICCEVSTLLGAETVEYKSYRPVTMKLQGRLVSTTLTTLQNNLIGCQDLHPFLLPRPALCQARVTAAATLFLGNTQGMSNALAAVMSEYGSELCLTAPHVLWLEAGAQGTACVPFASIFRQDAGRLVLTFEGPSTGQSQQRQGRPICIQM